MSTRVLQLALAVIVAVFAGVSLAGLALSAETPVYLQVTGVVSGFLALAAVWLLLRANRLAVAMLLVAAAIYFFSMVIPGFSRHGTQVFSALMPAFYVSVAIRLAFAALAHYVLSRLAVRA